MSVRRGKPSIHVMTKSMWLLFLVVLSTLPCLECQSTTTRNRIRQAVVVRRVRPVSSADTTSTTETSVPSDSEHEQESVLEDHHQQENSAASNDTFFSPFLNGFNQFNTRFNPFGRTPQQQTQQNFQQFPTATSQPFTQFAQQSGLAQSGSPAGNFQTVRLPNGQVVTQNNQFGVVSQQQQFPPFGTQPQQQPQLQQRPLQPANNLGGFPRFPQATNQEDFTGPTSVNFQTFGFQNPTSSTPQVPEPVHESDPIVHSLPDLPEVPRGSISSFPARERPFAPIEDVSLDAETASRGQSRFRGRPQTDDDLTESTRILRVRPNRPSTEPTEFLEDIPATDFDTGTDSSFGSTPPPLLTRVRGRPIVPDDFPGPSQAVRGAAPTEATTEEDDSSLTGPRSPVFSGRLRPGVRIVPTGNRARRPLTEDKDEQFPGAFSQEDKPEEPRFSNSGRPINNIQQLEEDQEPQDETSFTGTPKRRQRPVNRVPIASTPTPPRRKLRPFPQDDTKQDHEFEDETFDDSVPTVPSRLPTLSTTSIPETIQDLRSSSSVAVAPNLLIAQVQATRADEESRPSNGSGFEDDENDEANLIPFADVPHGDSEPGLDTNPIPDKDITVINLQKDRPKQNFKGFVDTDLIDDNLRLDEVPETEVSEQPKLSEFDGTPVPVPVPSPAPFIPTPLLIQQESTTSSTPLPFVPTSLPDQEQSTETINTESSPETIIPVKEEVSSETPEATSSSTTTTTPEPPPAPVTESTTSTTLTTASTTTVSSVSLNDELDRLQSSLDPWARLNDEEDEAAPNTTTPEPTTTTKISLFKIRSYVSVKTTTTTTVRPKSIDDLFKIRNGEKIGQSEETTKQAEQIEDEVDKAGTNSNKVEDKNASTIGKPEKESPETTENFESEGKTENPSARLKLFSSQRPGGLASHFVPKVKQLTTQDASTTITTSTTTVPTTLTTASTVEETTSKKGFGKDLLASIPLDDISSLFGGPPPKDEVSTGSIIQDDVSKFLPPGFNLGETTSSTTESSTSLLHDVLSTLDKKEKSFGSGSTGGRHGGFRPLGSPVNRPFKAKQNEALTSPSADADKVKEDILSNLHFDDVSALLPADFKPPPGDNPDEKGFSTILKDAVTDDISKFLPPGFKADATTEAPKTTNPSQEPPIKDVVTTTEPTKESEFGIKFPMRPGGVQNLGLPNVGKQAPSTPAPLAPKIKNFADIVKTTTEFTGWPTVDPPIGQKIDIKSLLASTSPATSETTQTTSTTETQTTILKTTTTTTTTTTRWPTTPGVCEAECRLAATIKISEGYEWSNSLLDPNTFEFQDLADKVKRELTELYRNSLVGDSFERLEIEAFSKGSILVDYYVSFKEFEGQVTTSVLKEVLNQQFEGQDGSSKLGRFTIDPTFTDFYVVPKEFSAPATDTTEDSGLPDWAIAVIVIGLGSFAFVLIFGITVLTNKRRRSSKKKHELPLTEDMLNELNKNSLSGGYSGSVPQLGGSTAYDNYGHDPDEFYDMEDVWNNDRYYGTKQKRQPNTSSSSGAYSKSTPYQSQLYDSWKTEWNAPYTEQYRTGPSGAPSRGSSAEMVPSAYRSKGTSYMTKGGRRPVYDDDF